MYPLEIEAGCAEMIITEYIKPVKTRERAFKGVLRLLHGNTSDKTQLNKYQHRTSVRKKHLIDFRWYGLLSDNRCRFSTLKRRLLLCSYFFPLLTTRLGSEKNSTMKQ